MRLRPPLLATILTLAACGAPRAAPPSGEAAPAPTTPPAGPAAPVPSLEPAASRPIPGGYAAIGVTGANKPNGLEYRLRQSVPADLPAWLRHELDGLLLWIADPQPDGGWLAFYRGSLERRPGDANAPFRAVLFEADGSRRWDLELNRFLSRPDHLEIQDVRLHGGKLYFNEACQSYSREAERRCSALVRLDPEAGRVEWRTGPLVSNNVFILHDPYVVAGYGFTAEPDSLYLLRQSTGEIVARRVLDSAHAYLEVVDGRLVVVTQERVYEFGL